MQGIILAAGKGTRLHPHTLTRSKAMMPVAGKPIVARVMESLRINGIRELVVVASEGDGEIRDYFRENVGAGIDVQFVVQKQLLGMAHALRLAAPHLRGPFVMSACDNLTPAAHVGELMETHRARGAVATLSLMEIDPAKTASTGIVAWCGEEIVSIVEKPLPHEAPSNISSLPLYVFSPLILEKVMDVEPSPRGEYEVQDAIQALIDGPGLVTGVFTWERIQLTNSHDLLALNRHYLGLMEEGCTNLSEQVDATCELLGPVYIETGVVVGSGSQIGPGVVVERGSRIGENCQIADAVILRGASIPANTLIVSEVINGDLSKGEVVEQAR